MKEIKFKKIIKLFDPLNYCKIYTTEDESPVFTGFVMDIPWYLLDYYLDNPKGDDYQAIGSFYDPTPENSNYRYGLEINLKEPEYVNEW